MIKWCSFCQRFQGEVPPFSDTTFTHGLCASCSEIGLDWSSEQEKRILQLKDFHRRFWSAGTTSNEKEMSRLIDDAAAAGIRSVDMLFAFVGPSLTKIGELWAANKLTPADEHAFTKIAMTMTDILSERIHVETSGTTPSKRAHRALLANITGNNHGLGLRFAALGYAGLGIWTERLPIGVSPDQIAAAAVGQNFSFVGLSVSQQSQEQDLQTTVELLLAEPKFQGNIVIGGFAVNEGLIQPFPTERVALVSRPRFDESELRFLTNG